MFPGSAQRVSGAESFFEDELVNIANRCTTLAELNPQGSSSYINPVTVAAASNIQTFPSNNPSHTDTSQTPQIRCCPLTRSWYNMWRPARSSSTHGPRPIEDLMPTQYNKRYTRTALPSGQNTRPPSVVWDRNNSMNRHGQPKADNDSEDDELLSDEHRDPSGVVLTHDQLQDRLAELQNFTNEQAQFGHILSQV